MKMKRNRKAISLVGIIAIIAMLLTVVGCAGDNGQGTDDVAGDTGVIRYFDMAPEDVTGEIVLWTWDVNIPLMVEEFHNRFPNVTVHYELIPDYGNRIAQMLAVGVDVPDVIMVESFQYGREANSPALMDLGAPPFNALELRDDFFAFWFDSGFGTDGVFRIMPNAPGMAGNFYRRDIAMELFGTDDPDEVSAYIATWEDVYQHGIRLLELTGQFIIADAGIVYHIMTRQNGVPSVEDDVINIDSFIEPLRMARRFRAAGIDARTPEWSAEWAAGLENGDVLMHPSGSWGEEWVVRSNVGDTQDGLWGVTDIPGGNINFGGNGFAIPAEAENIELAWFFIQYVTTDVEIQLTQFIAGSVFSAFIPASDNPYMLEPIPLFGGQIARERYREMGEEMILSPRTLYDQAIDSIIGQYLDGVFNGTMEPEEAMRLVREEMMTMFSHLQ